MRKFFSVFLSIFFISFFSTAQNSFFDKITLRKSFDSKGDRAEPASITLSKPQDAIASWATNMAIGYEVLTGTKRILTLDPFVEFHKNTLISKKQDNWHAGFALEWQTSKFEINSKRWSPILIASTRYNADNVKSNRIFQGSIYFTYLQKKKGTGFQRFYIPNYPVVLGKLLQFEYTPYIGIENENRLHSFNDSSKGNVYRFLGRITSQITLFPANLQWRKRFEFFFDYQRRNDFKKTIRDIAEDRHLYFATSFNYVFFISPNEKKQAKIGFDYIKGEDPTENFEKQSFYAISLKVKL